MSTLVTLSEHWEGMPASFIEGALLAANICPAPLDPDTWLSVLVTAGIEEDGEVVSLNQDDKQTVLAHLEQQYHALMRNDYVLPDSLMLSMRGELAQAFAEGFLAVWPYVEPHWHEVTLNDGSRRMLSALVTSMLLLHDEAGTLAQMKEVGIDVEPGQYIEQLDLMIQEVAKAADEAQQGTHGAHQVNPFKSIGRNDPCPCGSGAKFKKCCGR
ncbi:YecA family protein [Salinivibrio kushneri]|uniref:SEC-C metal-binding domain-containing protein n=1 Tax=Salinivibrio kushneri TaxID=1908198 RepID=A0AA47KJK3_9GAMM|nr:SEC-C metal-binding domain-containing protein [Salinivibrio kushneri]WBA07988.1 SEC-C metal-binding domain-containing protein [Salinivibrio kushneri]